MTLIKLTETHYIDSNELSDVEFRSDLAEPTLDISFKTYCSIRLYGSAALEAWGNIRNAVAGKPHTASAD